MNRAWLRWICRVFALALVLGSHAAIAEEITVGLSDVPDLIKRDLPEIQPGRELRLGALRLHPSFETRVEHDDNIRLSDTAEESDVLFTQTPGGRAEMKLGDHRLDVGYWAELIRFADNTEENAVNHVAEGNLRLNFGNLQVTLSDLLEDETSRLRDDISGRQHTLLNTAKARAHLDLPHWVAETGVLSNRVNYKADFFDGNDYTENILSLLLGRKISERTLVFVESDAGQVNYDTNVGNADQDYVQVMGGLKLRRTHEVDGEKVEKFSSVIRVGFQDRQLSDVGGSGPQDDFDGVVADADLFYRPSPTESVSLGYTATANVSTFGSNEWYRQDRVSFAWKKRLLRKLYAIPRVSWQHNHYPELATRSGVTDRRDDDILQFQTELRYHLRVNEATGQPWMWTSLLYTFRERDSNFDSLDFDSNRVALSVSFTY